MKNILIIKYGALGDIIIATSAIKQIQEYHHDCSVWLLTAPEYSSLLDNWIELNVITFPRKGLVSTIKTIVWIRNRGFHRLYDLQSNDRSRLLCALSCIPEQVGNHPYFPYTLHPKEDYSGQCHVFERMTELLASAGLPARTQPPLLPANNREKETIGLWLQENSLNDDSFVIMHAGSSPEHKAKRWPFYGDLAIRLASEGYQIVWVGTAVDMEINSMLSQNAGVNATNKFTVTELCELGRHAKFAVTNDSGPMHILSCSNIPVYAFFGPSNWQRNYAFGQKDRVFKIAGGRLEDISIDEVYDRLTIDGLCSGTKK